MLGLRIVPDPEWHVYWQNPGDAGLPPKLVWHLPDGFDVSPILYPAPALIPAGPLAAYGYHGEVLYPVRLAPDADLKTGDTVQLEVNASWLICKEECLPGSLTMKITLPVVVSEMNRPSEWADLFEAALADRPISAPSLWKLSAAVTSDNLILNIQADQSVTDSAIFLFFAGQRGVIRHGAKQLLSRNDNNIQLKIQRSPYSTDDPDSLVGILQVTDQGHTFNFEVAVPTSDSSPLTEAPTEQSSSLILAILLAFAGGIILNLMPCVLPVLSLKVVGLVEQAKGAKKAVLWHGAGFSAGIIVTFWALALLMLILQAGGAQLGWGFQLQSPAFVLVMAGFMFLLALNMFGLFEISFLTRSAGSMAGSARSGVSGAFLSGIIATLLATPCTAPFMGSALGYTLTQPPLISLSVYTALGVGMAAPYFLLTSFPSLLRFVPKPGRWIETLKQAMGFLLIATVIWLAWVLSIQSGGSALLILHIVLLGLAIAAWIYGRWSFSSGTMTTIAARIGPAIITIAVLAVGVAAIGSDKSKASDSIVDTGSETDWIEYKQDDLEALLKEGRSVFVDFTAAWCLSCQVNEQVALETEEVARRFKELDVVLMKADWTRQSPEITQALARYGRNSVPLYLLYGSGTDEPIRLPEILTPGIVLDALDKIEPLNITP